MKIAWEAQIGIAVILIAILFFAGFFTHKWTIKPKVMELVRTEIKWLPSTELKYYGKASLKDVSLQSIPIKLIEASEAEQPLVNGLIKVAGFDSLYSDSVRISGEYYYPPVNMFDIRYKIPPRSDTTYYYESVKIYHHYDWFNHGIVASTGYDPIRKQFGFYVGYGVTLSLHNLFKK